MTCCSFFNYFEQLETPFVGEWPRQYITYPASECCLMHYVRKKNCYISYSCRDILYNVFEHLEVLDRVTKVRINDDEVAIIPNSWTKIVWPYSAIEFLAKRKFFFSFRTPLIEV